MCKPIKKLGAPISLSCEPMKDKTLLKETYFNNLDIRFREIKKLEDIEYMESLIASLSEMARQSGESFIAHLLNMALREATDKRRMISSSLEPESM